MIQITEKLKAHFLRLYKIALADDDFSQLEMKMLYDFAKERGISDQDLDKILLNKNNLVETYPETFDEKIEYLYDMTELIWADGFVDENEKNALEKYIKTFGFFDENITKISDYLISSVKDKKTLTEILTELNA